ncbi:hypothetical protein EGW08_003340 [Elysia chlorotica]|uniref:Chitin-binding type-4 domain-containing protein n=1 Tax=Elysia chlorotica TaxID=188477 RepID=A0A3S0ZX49_ELYCH|nr:hypothetical protein EGW08_003340 [Elysia chlorotica]
MWLLPLAVLALSALPTPGHICLLSPPQRGSMVGINQEDSDDCLLYQAPCGGRDPQSPLILTVGQRFVVTWQKNVDHFNSSTPGYFSVLVLDADHPESAGSEILHVPDSPDPALTLYWGNVTVPDTPGPGILQLRYYITNQDSALIYYQCSDVLILPDTRPTRLKLTQTSMTGPGILQLRYYITNLHSALIYYQCSDVLILPETPQTSVTVAD